MFPRHTTRLFVGLLCLASSAFAVAAPPRSGVGFEQTRTVEGIEVGIWYPAQGQAQHQRLGIYEQHAIPNAAPIGERLPLIVMSHGNGGHFAGHHDTAYPATITMSA